MKILGFLPIKKKRGWKVSLNSSFSKDFDKWTGYGMYVHCDVACITAEREVQDTSVKRDARGREK